MIVNKKQESAERGAQEREMLPKDRDKTDSLYKLAFGLTGGCE